MGDGRGEQKSAESSDNTLIVQHLRQGQPQIGNGLFSFMGKGIEYRGSG
jgi:hypothetical protein